jgi:hypothetical protein
MAVPFSGKFPVPALTHFEIHPFLIEKYKQGRITENAKVSVNRSYRDSEPCSTCALSGNTMRGKTRSYTSK